MYVTALDHPTFSVQKMLLGATTRKCFFAQTFDAA